MKRFPFFLVIFLLIPCFASAQIANPSFESGTDPGLSGYLEVFAPDSTTITDWAVVNGNVDYIGIYWQAAEGVRSIDLNGVAPGVIEQDIATQIGASYILTFAMSGNPDDSGPPAKTMLVTATNNPSQLYTYDVIINGNSRANMKWADDQYLFKATTSVTTLRFESTTVGQYGPALDYLRITEVTPPTLSKAFDAANIPLNGSTSLSFTVNNPNTTTTLTGIAFTDTLPAGLVISTPNGLTGSCGGGTITATQATNVINLSGASLVASASCTFSVNVTGTASGTQNNTTGAVSSTESGTGGTASASIAVVAPVVPPSFAKAFNPGTTAVNAPSLLTFTITNPAANTVALTGIAFTDTLPAGLVISTPNGLIGSCGGGSITATAGTALVTLSGATLAANSSCNFSVSVTGTTTGLKTNTTSTLNTAQGVTGSPATASLTVSAAAAVPTLTGWGIILLTFLLGFSYVYFLKRRRRSIE